MSTIGAGEGRLRELGDLAQRTSLQVELDGRTAAVAIGNGELLRSLLRAPNDPYELDVERNALLMYRGASAPVAALVRDCLRP